LIESVRSDFSVLDHPAVTRVLFHPRPDPQKPGKSPGFDITIPVENDTLGARIHLSGETYPNILYFHGNGEIATDYDEIGPVFNRMGLNVLIVDYRGYGRSTGQPTASNLICDSHLVFRYVKNWLISSDYSGHFIVMGRSLGSAPALELALHYKDQISALVLESAFARSGPLLALLGIDLGAIGLYEGRGFGNVEKIADVEKPVLIIHAENDRIIPFSDAEQLFSSCPSPEKTLVKIPGADHNDIFLRGFSEYLRAITSLVDRLT